LLWVLYNPIDSSSIESVVSACIDNNIHFVYIYVYIYTIIMAPFDVLKEYFTALANQQEKNGRFWALPLDPATSCHGLSNIMGFKYAIMLDMFVKCNLLSYEWDYHHQKQKYIRKFNLNRRRIRLLFACIDGLELTEQNISIGDGDEKIRYNYFIVRLGKTEKFSTFKQQREMEAAGDIPAPSLIVAPKHAAYHKALIEEFNDVITGPLLPPPTTAAASPEAATTIDAVTPPTPTTQSTTVKAAAVDTPMQIKFGATDLTTEISDEELKKTCPYITSHGFSLHSTFDIEAMLRDIHALSKKLPAKDIMSFRSQNGFHRKMIALPRTSTRDSFQAVAKKNDLIQTLVEGLTPIKDPAAKQLSLVAGAVNDGDDDREKDYNPIIEWLIELLGQEDDNALIEACKRLGLPVAGPKLTPEGFAAMLLDANIGTNAGKVIRSTIQ